MIDIQRFVTLQYVTNKDVQYLAHYITSDVSNTDANDIRDMKFIVRKIGNLVYDREYSQWVLKSEAHEAQLLNENEMIDYNRAFESACISLGWLNHFTEQSKEGVS